MKWRTKLLVLNVDIHAEFLDKVVHCGRLIALSSHMQHVHSLRIGCMNIGTQLDQVFEHLQVAIECCKVNSSKA